MPSTRGPGRGFRRRMCRKAKPHARLPARQSKPMKNPFNAAANPFIAAAYELQYPKFVANHHFTPTESDVESDAAVWDLYDRWCLRNVNRTPEQRQRRFSYFKKEAIEVVELNKKDPTNPRSLTGLADSTDKELNFLPCG